MKKLTLPAALIVLATVFLAKDVSAGPPLTNLEGVGGIAFNPLAYPADDKDGEALLRIFDSVVLGKPRIGGWYTRLSDVSVDWTAVGAAATFSNRLEISYGYQTINQEKAPARRKHNIGAKFLLLPENYSGLEFLPALSVGSIWKQTSGVEEGVDGKGVDYYAAATKLITRLPLPAVISGGAFSTKGKATGVFGYAPDRSTSWFGNINIFLPGNLIAGFEYKQGADFSDWKDADYWNVHLGWAPNENLTLVLAHVNAGDHEAADRIGLGKGTTLSMQYAF